MHGVALLMTPEATRALLSWEPVSPRIITARFNSRGRKVTILQCYAPTKLILHLLKAKRNSMNKSKLPWTKYQRETCKSLWETSMQKLAQTTQTDHGQAWCRRTEGKWRIVL